MYRFCLSCALLFTTAHLLPCSSLALARERRKGPRRWRKDNGLSLNRSRQGKALVRSDRKPVERYNPCTDVRGQRQVFSSESEKAFLIYTCREGDLSRYNDGKTITQIARPCERCIYAFPRSWRNSAFRAFSLFLLSLKWIKLITLFCLRWVSQKEKVRSRTFLRRIVLVICFPGISKFR